VFQAGLSLEYVFPFKLCQADKTSPEDRQDAYPPMPKHDAE
jgi:hypothetical protein